MANFVERFKNLVAPAPYDDEEYIDDYDEDDYYEEPAPRPQVMSFNQAKARKANADKVISLNTSVSMQVVVSYPKTFEDAEGLCKKLQERQTVVVNLGKTDQGISQRIGDFLCGAGIALRCSIQAIADDIFIICPENVKITGDFKQELAANGVDIPSAVWHK